MKLKTTNRLCDNPLYLTLPIVTLGLAALFFILSVASASLNSDRINRNILTSEQYIIEDDNYSLRNPLLSKDVWTDAIIVGISGVEDSCGVVHKAMTNPIIIPTFTDTCIYIKESAMGYVTYYEGHTDSDSIAYGHYGRYWHGYQTVVKPLLMITHYPYIRIINNLLLFTLALLSLYVINVRTSWQIGFIFLLSLFAMGFVYVPEMLQFSTCFYISFIATTLILLNNKDSITTRYGILYFYCVGAFTQYFDFLTTPLITLGVPLILTLIYTSRLSDWKYTLKLSAAWLGGYVVLWGTKWVLASALTDFNVIANAFNQLKFRSQGDIPINLTMWSWSKYFLILLFGWWLASLSLLTIRYRGLLFKARELASLLIVAAFPFFWIVIIRNHSLVHYWFVWRIFGVTVFALLIYWYGIFKPTNQQSNHTHSSQNT